MTLYWIGGNGSWTDSAHWAASSGGAGGAGFPGIGDDVVFDNNSAGGNFVVTLVAGQLTNCRNFTATGLTTKDLKLYSTYDSGSGTVGGLGLYGTLTGGTRLSVEGQTGSLNGTTFLIRPKVSMNINWSTWDSTAAFIYPEDTNITLTLTGALNIGSAYLVCSLDTGNYNITVNETYRATSYLELVAGTGVTHNLGSSVIETRKFTYAFGGGSGYSLNAGTSTIRTKIITKGALSLPLNNVEIYPSPSGGWNSSYATSTGSFEFNNLKILAPSPTNRFFYISPSGTTIVLNGTFTRVQNANTLWIRTSSTLGQTATISKASGIVAMDNLNLFNITATGGAPFYAGAASTDGGGNTGWIFSDPVYNISETSTISGFSEADLEYEFGELIVQSSISGGGSIAVLTQFQSLSQKDYEYRVYTHDWDYITTWANEVKSDFGYSQRVNENASELNVQLARSPDNVVVGLSALLDTSNDAILDQNNSPILVQTETTNSVGDGTDVDLNYNVDVISFYGGFEQLLDHNTDPILDTNLDPILVQFGNPNGLRVYSGYIADYEMTYGEKVGVDVTIVPHATEMSHYVYHGVDDETTITLNSTDPVSMARLAMDVYNSEGGIITYDSTSMPLSGTTSSYEFKLQTTREVVDKTIELLPQGYYHFVHPGENKQYLLEKSETADHTFWYEKHIGELKLRKSITQLVNKVYFVGGEVSPDVDLFRYYDDVTSITDYRPGLERLTDSRVILNASAQVLSQAKINEYKLPRYRTTITLNDGVYDIESIRLGQMVNFRNFGNFVDSLLLQIVSVTRSSHTITFELDMVVPGDTKRLEEIKRNILSEAIAQIPDTATNL